MRVLTIAAATLLISAIILFCCGRTDMAWIAFVLIAPVLLRIINIAIVRWCELRDREDKELQEEISRMQYKGRLIENDITTEYHHDMIFN